MCTGICAMHILCILLRLGEQMSTSFQLHRRITYLLCIFFIPALQFSCFRFESLATYTFSIHQSSVHDSIDFHIIISLVFFFYLKSTFSDLFQLFLHNSNTQEFIFTFPKLFLRIDLNYLYTFLVFLSYLSYISKNYLPHGLSTYAIYKE